MTDQAQSPHDEESGSIRSAASRRASMALHLASEHADLMAMERAAVENEEQHRHEHAGPGTIRNHDEADLSWDREKAGAVLAESGEEEAPQGGLPPIHLVEDETSIIFGSAPSGGKYRVYDRLMREMLASLEAKSGQPPMVVVADLKDAPADGLPLAGHDGEEDDPAARAHLDVHLSTAHDDDEAWYRTPQENEAAHRAVLPHQHTAVQHRYERALAERIEADLGHGTLIAWSPLPHPPHGVADLARMIGDIHKAAPDMTPDLIALDLAWIKTAAWPWHRRLRAALLLAIAFSSPPSWRLGRR